MPQMQLKAAEAQGGGGGAGATNAKKRRTAAAAFFGVSMHFHSHFFSTFLNLITPSSWEV